MSDLMLVTVFVAQSLVIRLLNLYRYQKIGSCLPAMDWSIET
ncbi:uncharacterized protein METZ01_LOCUS62706 [marine metagenome]|uniref:Uncharacterized protein n=1 Tax=marine metagenome TaxID=408172 RepID=A0A381T0U2_9ZZZZ